MKKLNIFNRLRAAQNMSYAFDQKTKFTQGDLKTLGLPEEFSSRFHK